MPNRGEYYEIPRLNPGEAEARLGVFLLESLGDFGAAGESLLQAGARAWGAVRITVLGNLSPKVFATKRWAAAERKQSSATPGSAWELQLEDMGLGSPGWPRVRGGDDLLRRGGGKARDGRRLILQAAG